MKMWKGLEILLVIFHFQLAISHQYQVTCTLKLTTSSPSPSSSSSLSTPSSSSSSSSILLASLSSSSSSTSSGDLSELNYKSSCKTKNDSSVVSQVTGDDDDGLYCLMFVCQCATGQRSKTMATCHEVKGSEVRITCTCCSDGDAVCVWTEPQTTITTTSATTTTTSTTTTTTTMGVNRTSKVSSFHVFYSDPRQSSNREPANQTFVVVFVIVGVLFMSAFMFVFIFFKLKHAEASDNSRSSYFSIAHGFSYAKLYQKKTCKSSTKAEKSNVLRNCAASRPRTFSYNGGELARNPIIEVEEENVEI